MLEVADPRHALAASRARSRPAGARRRAGSPRIGSRTRPRSSRSVARQSMSNQRANAGGGAVREHVVPGGVLARCGHVVGHDVEHDPHAARRQLRVQRLEVGLGAELGIEARRVHHVVAVRAAPPSLEHGRAVDVADAEPAQVGDELAGRGEGKAGVELQPVGGADLGHAITAAARSGAASASAPPRSPCPAAPRAEPDARC